MIGCSAGVGSLSRFNQMPYSPAFVAVPDVRDLDWSETEPGAALREDLDVGFGGTRFAGSDDLRQFGGESDAPELLTLLVGVAVGDDSQAEVAVMFRECVECRPDVGISAPGGFVVM